MLAVDSVGSCLNTESILVSVIEAFPNNAGSGLRQRQKKLFILICVGFSRLFYLSCLLCYPSQPTDLAALAFAFTISWLLGVWNKCVVSVCAWLA